MVSDKCEEAEVYMRFGSRAERRSGSRESSNLHGKPNHFPFPDGLTIVCRAEVTKVVGAQLAFDSDRGQAGEREKEREKSLLSWRFGGLYDYSICMSAAQCAT